MDDSEQYDLGVGEYLWGINDFLSRDYGIDLGTLTLLEFLEYLEDAGFSGQSGGYDPNLEMLAIAGQADDGPLYETIWWAGVVESAAVGVAAGVELGAGPFVKYLGRKGPVFGSKGRGILNRGGRLRIGFGDHRERNVFRISGNIVRRINRLFGRESSHWNLWKGPRL